MLAGLDAAGLMPQFSPGARDHTDEPRRLHADLGVLPSRAGWQRDFAVDVVS